MKNIIKVGIIGGAGYTGGELLRILLNHPNVEITFVHSSSNAGNPVSKIHADLAGETTIQFTQALNPAIDVLFLCSGHGDSKKFLDSHAGSFSDETKIIDLSNDFRLSASSVFKKEGITREFIYGLPELNKEAIRNSRNIANPGCFATAIQLGLLPLAKAGILGQVYTTGITGSTGAGQGLAATSHFSWRANNIQAYKTLTHQHLNEIYQSLHQLQTSFPLYGEESGNLAGLNFIPWRGDFTRGIFISSQTKCSLSLNELHDMYRSFYESHPFTFIVENSLFLKQVVNSNKCLIQLEKVNDQLVIHSAIDNLLKGASGQAVQNMNLMFGLEEKAGLGLKPAAF